MKSEQSNGRQSANGNRQGLIDGEVNVYISQIADRIKSIRVRRGMTRKLLSEHSEISERYLSQLESGQANISMALLWRVARAMDVEVQELLPDCLNCNMVPAPLFGILKKLDPLQLKRACTLLKQQLLPEGTTQLYGVALIGLRGAGKSTLGKLLAQKTGVKFVNLVDMVERLSGIDVAELFSLGGQKGYRRLEFQALGEVLEKYPQAILEAGGSLVTQADTFQKLLDNYYTIWIKAEPNEHMERVMAQGDFRPMQGNVTAMEDLQRMLAEREREYQAAHYVLNTGGRTVDSCFEELVAQAGPHLRY